jgi:MarR family transcriptional regulator, repressor for mepA
LQMQSLFWQESVGMLIAATRRRIKQEVWRRLRVHRITPPQFGTLLILHREKDISLSSLVEHMGIDAPTGCRIVRNLVRRKLIRAEHCSDDRRRFRLKLTPAGEKLASDLQALRSEIDEDIVRGLTQSEKTVLGTALKKIIANVERMGNAGARPVNVRRAGGTRR